MVPFVLTLASVPIVKPVAVSDCTRFAASAVAPVSAFALSPVIVEVRITPICAVAALTTITSG